MTWKKSILVVAMALMVLPLAAQEATPEATMEPMLPATIEFEVPAELEGLQPEGIEYDAVGERFLFGSLTYGTIHSLSNNGDGTMALDVVVEDEALMSTVGLEVDKTNNRLLVANSAASAFMGSAGAAMLGS